MNTPSFNFDAVEPEPERSTWTEVPQALFLSWSALRQWAYCRDRDFDSATFADSFEDAQFFIHRAEMYQQMIKEAL